MNVTLKPFDFAQAVARAGLAVNGLPLATGRPVQGSDLQRAASPAPGAVRQSQRVAARPPSELQMGSPTVGLEQTMVAMQQGPLGLQASLQVRNRLVQVYSEIMNLQV